MMTKFMKGQFVKLNGDALLNYGEEWTGVVLVVTHVATAYMPAKQFFANGKPNGYHPGYDSEAKGKGLYDLKRNDNNAEFPYSLYDWELVACTGGNK